MCSYLSWGRRENYLLASLGAVRVAAPALRASAFPIQHFRESGDDFQVERISVSPTSGCELASWFRELVLCFSQVERRQFLISSANPQIINDANISLDFFFFFVWTGQKCPYRSRTVCYSGLGVRFTDQYENKHGPLRWCLKGCWMDETLFTLSSSMKYW